ncbi:hypothetical protein AQZ52_17515 [Novosphingobium fuchskuhlense]|uniref:Uncharacterized protein n=1 Tax=Novosphingobium fuchskuhlense TaxID=1117702 RepID=A0A117US76_9SPHN|nr:hypothetical protein AQZ52_17515 [Novosphingobium fuchskuhlense]
MRNQPVVAIQDVLHPQAMAAVNGQRLPLGAAQGSQNNTAFCLIEKIQHGVEIMVWQRFQF